VSGQLHALATLLPGKEPWYTLDRRLDSPQSRSKRGCEEKISSPGRDLNPARPARTTELSRLLTREVKMRNIILKGKQKYINYLVQLLSCEYSKVPSPKIAGAEVTVLTCIREVPGSYLGRFTRMQGYTSRQTTPISDTQKWKVVAVVFNGQPTTLNRISFSAGYGAGKLLHRKQFHTTLITNNWCCMVRHVDISLPLLNAKVHLRFHTRPPLVPIFSQVHPVHNFPPYFHKIHSNISFSSMFRSIKRSLPFRFYD
jgi:hypothetical protein